MDTFEPRKGTEGRDRRGDECGEEGPRGSNWRKAGSVTWGSGGWGIVSKKRVFRRNVGKGLPTSEESRNF